MRFCKSDVKLFHLPISEFTHPVSYLVVNISLEKETPLQQQVEYSHILSQTVLLHVSLSLVWLVPEFRLVYT